MPWTPLPNITSMQRIGDVMQAHWARFASTGDPNAHGLKWIPKSPAYDDEQEGGKNFVYNAALDNVLNLHTEDDNLGLQRSIGLTRAGSCSIEDNQKAKKLRAACNERRCKIGNHVVWFVLRARSPQLRMPAASQDHVQYQ